MSMPTLSREIGIRSPYWVFARLKRRERDWRQVSSLRFPPPAQTDVAAALRRHDADAFDFAGLQP
jgi:hypothetical protein